jgi:hypothetical protein
MWPTRTINRDKLDDLKTMTVSILILKRACQSHRGGKSRIPMATSQTEYR